MKKTCQVCRELPASYTQITAALRARKLRRPQKDASGDFMWSPGDVAALRRALALDLRLVPRARRDALRKGVSA